MTRRPHFIVVVWGLTPGGTLSVLREWVPRLRRAGSVSIVTLGPNRASLDAPTVEVGSRWSHPLRFPHVALYVARMAVAAARAGRRGSPAVLLPQDALATGAAAGIASALTGARLVAMEHGSADAIGTERFWRERYPPAGLAGRVRHRLLRWTVAALHRWTVSRADGALVAGDEGEAALRAAGLPAERIIRYRFPVDLDRYRPASVAERGAARAQWGFDDDAFVVLSVSRLAPEKGIDDLIAAVAALNPAGARPLLVIAGDGPLRAALEEQARRLNVAGRFLGAVEANEVAALHRAADVFVYPGRQGANTPYAVLEAMASGSAVIATTAPPVHRAMLDGGRGIAIAPDDHAAMRQAIEDLRRDPGVRRRMGDAARAYVERHHAPSALDADVDRFVSWIGGARRPR